MKKNGLMKALAVLATATMMITAAGMTVAGAESENEIVSVSYDRYVGGETISLRGANATPGEIVEIPVVMNTNNQCTSFDVLVEYDARLDFVGVEGARMSNSFEEGGRKFVSILGYEIEPYQDGEAAATIKLQVPEVAENGSYEVKFQQISSFSNDSDNFANYKSTDAAITVTGGVQRADSALIELTSVNGMAGDTAEVQVIPTANDQCSSYEMLLEYDSRLTLDKSDVKGVNTMCIFEEDGRAYISIVGYTTGTYADGKAMASLNFHIPADAISGETFDVKVVEVSNISTELYDFDNYTISDATLSVVESMGCKGDANVDGKADVRDAALIAKVCANKKYANQITEMGKKLGDVDENQTINVRDAAKIARYVSKGKISWELA